MFLIRFYLFFVNILPKKHKSFLWSEKSRNFVNIFKPVSKPFFNIEYQTNYQLRPTAIMLWCYLNFWSLEPTFKLLSKLLYGSLSLSIITCAMYHILFYLFVRNRLFSRWSIRFKNPSNLKNSSKDFFHISAILYEMKFKTNTFLYQNCTLSI